MVMTEDKPLAFTTRLETGASTVAEPETIASWAAALDLGQAEGSGIPTATTETKRNLSHEHSMD